MKWQLYHFIYSAVTHDLQVRRSPFITEVCSLSEDALRARKEPGSSETVPLKAAEWRYF